MFLTPLQLEATRPDMWRVVSPLVWSDPLRGCIVVPADFPTDLASIPRAFRNLPWLDPDGPSRRPAVMHDWFYGSRSGRRWGKDFADAFLKEALLVEGCGSASAALIYNGVHWFGRSSWDADGLRLSAPNSSLP